MGGGGGEPEPEEMGGNCCVDPAGTTLVSAAPCTSTLIGSISYILICAGLRPTQC